MKVKYLGETDPLGFIKGEVYDVISVEDGPGDTKWYRIELPDDDDDGSGTPGYLYHDKHFEIIEK